MIVAADGYLGQMTGKVTLPRTLVKPGLPAWALQGLSCWAGVVSAAQVGRSIALLQRAASTQRAKFRAGVRSMVESLVIG